MAVRDIHRVRYDATGGEAAVSFTALSPAAALDKLEEIRLTRNGADLDHDELTIATDGTSVSWTVPSPDYAIGAGEWFDLWYLGDILPSHPGAATRTAIVDAAMTLVRGPEGLNVTVADISDLNLQVACEASYYDLLQRFAASVPSVASLSVTDTGTGSDVYHFARAVGFLTAARLVNGTSRGGGLKKISSDDGTVEYFGPSEDGADAGDLVACAEREMGLVSLIAVKRSEQAAAFPLFGVTGPRRSRKGLSGSQAWRVVLSDLLGTENPLDRVAPAAAQEGAVRYTVVAEITASADPAVNLKVSAEVGTPVPASSRVLGFSSRGNLDPMGIALDDSRTHISFTFPEGTDPALDPDLDWVTFAY